MIAYIGICSNYNTRTGDAQGKTEKS